MALQRVALRGLADRLFPPGSPQALELIRAAWPVAVGAEVARRTEVLALDGHTLRVRVPDAGWRSTLHRMRGPVLGRLRALAGQAAPDRLGFSEGPLAAPAAPPPPRAEPAPPPPPPPGALVQAAAAITDPDLRRRFLEAAARYLRRAAPPAARRENEDA